MVRVFLLIGLLASLLGCSKAMTEQEYANAFKVSCEKYFAVAQEVSSAELPDKTGLTKSERYKVLAQHARTQNAKFKALIPEIKALNPPTKYSALNTAYLELLEGQTKRDDEYSAAIDAEDGPLSDRLSNEYVKFIQSQMLKVLDEIEKAGGEVSQLRESFRQIMEEQS